MKVQLIDGQPHVLVTVGVPSSSVEEPRQSQLFDQKVPPDRCVSDSVVVVRTSILGVLPSMLIAKIKTYTVWRQKSRLGITFPEYIYVHGW